MPDDKLPTMLTVEEVAARWRVKPRTIYAMIAAKELIALRVGRLVRISRSHVEFLESGRGAQPSEPHPGPASHGVPGFPAPRRGRPKKVTSMVAPAPGRPREG